MADDGAEEREFPDADMAAALRVLKAALDDEVLWKSKACRKLRAAVAPLGERLRAAMFGGAPEGDYKLSAKRKRADDTVKNFLKLEDRKTLEKTRLRAGRIAKLNDLTAADGHTARVLDGVGDDDGMGGRLIKDGDAGAGEGEGAPPAAEGEAEGADAGRSLHFPRACYACKRRFTELHHFYDTLCPTCSALNWTKRHQRANLAGRVALVTGARVKIGFHVCLKVRSPYPPRPIASAADDSTQILILHPRGTPSGMPPGDNIRAPTDAKLTPTVHPPPCPPLSPRPHPLSPLPPAAVAGGRFRHRHDALPSGRCRPLCRPSGLPVVGQPPRRIWPGPARHPRRGGPHLRAGTGLPSPGHSN